MIIVYIQSPTLNIDTQDATPEIETPDTTIETESSNVIPKPSIRPRPVKDKPKPEYNNIITELDPLVVAERIHEYALLEWAGDYSMQEYIIEEQNKSYRNLLTIVIDSQIKNIIIQNAFENSQYELDYVKYRINC